jgi:hypothetical protein
MKILNKIREMKALNTKGQVFDQVSGLMVGLAGLAITAVVVFLILSQTKANSTVAGDANATAAIGTLQQSGDDAVSFVPLIVIAAIGAVLLGLVSLFRGRR